MDGIEYVFIQNEIKALPVGGIGSITKRGRMDE